MIDKTGNRPDGLSAKVLDRAMLCQKEILARLQSGFFLPPVLLPPIADALLESWMDALRFGVDLEQAAEKVKVARPEASVPQGIDALGVVIVDQLQDLVRFEGEARLRLPVNPLGGKSAMEVAAELSGWARSAPEAVPTAFVPAGTNVAEDLSRGVRPITASPFNEAATIAALVLDAFEIPMVGEPDQPGDERRILHQREMTKALGLAEAFLARFREAILKEAKEGALLVALRTWLEIDPDTTDGQAWSDALYRLEDEGNAWLEAETKAKEGAS